MAKHHANLLGLAITEKSVQIAECRGVGRSAKAGKRSSLAIDGASLFEDPQRFGEQLAAHLKQAGFATKHAAVGLCARWVLARPMTLPPAEGAALAGMARLKIEREFAGGQGELCFDYQEAPLPTQSGGEGTAGQRGLLLVGMPKRRLEKLQTAMQAAGLEMVRLGATPLDLCSEQDGDGLALIVDAAGLTLTRRAEGKCAGFVTTGCNAQAMVTDPNALQNAANSAARLAATSFSSEADPSAALLLSDTADLDRPVLDDFTALLAERFGSCDSRSADAALAAARSAGVDGAINLLDSKLAVKPARALPSYAKWLVRAAVVLLLVGGVVGYLWVDANRELADLQDEYNAISDSAAKLQAVRDDTRAAAGWFDERPPVLDCLLELTHTFPREGRIWVTSLAIDPDAAGLVSCRADDEETMWLYVNAMNASPRLNDVVLRRQNDAGRQADEIVFDVSFRFDESADQEEEAL